MLVLICGKLVNEGGLSGANEKTSLALRLFLWSLRFEDWDEGERIPPRLETSFGWRRKLGTFGHHRAGGE